MSKLKQGVTLESFMRLKREEILKIKEGTVFDLAYIFCYKLLYTKRGAKIQPKKSKKKFKKSPLTLN